METGGVSNSSPGLGRVRGFLVLCSGAFNGLGWLESATGPLQLETGCSNWKRGRFQLETGRSNWKRGLSNWKRDARIGNGGVSNWKRDARIGNESVSNSSPGLRRGRGPLLLCLRNLMLQPGQLILSLPFALRLLRAEVSVIFRLWFVRSSSCLG